MKKVFSLFVVIMITGLSFSQGLVKGIVVDKSTGEALVGVSVLNPASGAGVATSLDGSFTIKIPGGKQELAISYIGYFSKIIDVSTKKADLGTISIENQAIGLNDVTVTSSVAIRRKTPVALSVVDPVLIENKLGTQEFPEILKSTPGIYATKQGGGYGDSRINLRGFESTNVAVMINGVPMNDMENGKLYWSNWAGLSDVTRSMQVQRGLGASKVAAPSVGGTINIVTKSTEAKKGGSLYYGIGLDGYEKVGLSFSTGLLPSGWAITMMGSKASANTEGLIQGTNYEVYSYFLNVSKIINDEHQISFTAFGAPQWHNKRSDQLLVSEWAKYGQRYNSGYGFDVNGQNKTFNYNYSHKPQFSLNHFWTINHITSLSTALYTSICDAGGGGSVGVNRNDSYGSTGGIVNTKYRKPDGTFDYSKIMTENAASETGSLIAMQTSINNHNWYGLLSTFNTTIFDKYEVQVGVDMRYYKGIHQSKVFDLLGGQFVIDPARLTGKFSDNPSWVNEKMKVGDITYRNYNGYVGQEGVFGQIEYNKDKLSSFIAGSVNNTSYWRVDNFYYDNVKSDVANKLGYNIKGGLNYNLTKNHNVFANIGYFTRTPFLSGGIFLSIETNNSLNKDAINERIFTSELGYGYSSKNFSANINIYRTNWMDKSMIRSLDSTDPASGTINLSGVNALHQGIEIDFKSIPVKNLEITGMLSLGDWTWQGISTGYLYNRDGQPINASKDVVELKGPDHAFVTVDLNGIKVGNSAQTTANISVNYSFLKDFKMGLDYTYFGRNYSNYNVNINKWGVNKFDQPWEIPAAGVTDFYANYRFDLGSYKATVFGNISNLFDSYYITDAQDGGTHTWDTASVFYSMGRSWSIGLKLMF